MHQCTNTTYAVQCGRVGLTVLDLCPQKEIEDIVRVGYLNGLFVLARSIGLIGGANACQVAFINFLGTDTGLIDSPRTDSRLLSVRL